MRGRRSEGNIDGTQCYLQLESFVFVLKSMPRRLFRLIITSAFVFNSYVHYAAIAHIIFGTVKPDIVRTCLPYIWPDQIMVSLAQSSSNHRPIHPVSLPFCLFLRYLLAVSHEMQRLAA